MKNIIFLLFIFETINFSAQETIPFGGDIYKYPRFKEDSLIPETQYRKLFKIKLKKILVEKLNKFDENPFRYDTIKRAILTFYIDSTGISNYKREYPENSFKPSFITFFQKLIDSVPRFIPAKARDVNTVIFYSLPLWNPDYLKK